MTKEGGIINLSALTIVGSALSALKDHEEEINLLNVFPVPDGDTGSNMVHTIESVYSALAALAGADKKQILNTITEASLLGGRGNSGVILSQIIKGLCESLLEADILDAKSLSCALTNSAQVAFRAIKKPAEGTILTVIRDMAQASKRAKTDDIVGMLSIVLEAARESVARGPKLLPVLKEAGVVDAGGWGLLVMTSAILSLIKGEKAHEELIGRSLPKNLGQETDLTFTYCTELTISGSGVDLKALEDQLSNLGDSLIVVGKDDLAHIHIHTDLPGEVLNIAIAAGSALGIKINNMAREIKEMAAGSNPSRNEIAVIAIASGDGIKRILISLGAARVISGGQTMNVSVKDILAVIDDLSQSKIIILPGNKNIILAAERATAMTEKEIIVVESRSVPESFSALLAFDPTASFKENASSMRSALQGVISGELTQAVRDAKMQAGNAKKGDFLGLIDHQVSVIDSSFNRAALRLVEKMLTEESESLTLIFGAETKTKEREALAKELIKQHKSLEIESLDGGQPLYHLIVGVD